MMFYKGYNIHNITKIEKCKHIVTSSIFSDCYVVQYVFKVIFTDGITANVYSQETFYKSHNQVKWIKVSREIKNKKQNAYQFAMHTDTHSVYRNACEQLQELLNMLHNDGVFPKQFFDNQMCILKEKYPIFLNNIDNIHCGPSWYSKIFTMIEKIEKMNNDNRKVKIVADNIRESRGKLYVNWHLVDYSFGDCKEWCKDIVDCVKNCIDVTSTLCEQKCSLCSADRKQKPCICEVENNYVR